MCPLACSRRLTICKDTLTRGGAGVLHFAAGWDLHAVETQLIVAPIDAGVLDIQLGDTALAQASL